MLSNIFTSLTPRINKLECLYLASFLTVHISLYGKEPAPRVEHPKEHQKRDAFR